MDDVDQEDEMDDVDQEDKMDDVDQEGNFDGQDFEIKKRPKLTFYCLDLTQ